MRIKCEDMELYDLLQARCGATLRKSLDLRSTEFQLKALK